MRPVLCPVLVGRDQELGRLKAALAEARGGQGGVVMLAGDPGIGKSRLAREVANIARHNGCLVLTGRAVDGGAPTPFRPFAEALAAALRPGRLPASDELDPFRPALRRLIPHLEPHRQADQDESLVFLGEAVLQVLRVLAPEAGCLLALEDLHWADRETLALVEYVADNVWAERVLCVGTFRSEDRCEVSDLVAKLETRGSATLLHLSPLDVDLVTRMAQACLGASLLPSAATTVVAGRAEGVPFLVEEILAGLLEDGALVERAGQWKANGPITAKVPASFAAAVAARMSAIAADSQRVLHAAAVLGRQFDWSLLGRMTGAREETLTTALRAGVERQLLVSTEDGFGFRHALTHDAVLRGILPPERAELAARGLAALQETHPGLPDSWCVLAADLAALSGDTVRAGELLVEAAQRDLAVGALASAEQTLTRASEMVGSDGTLAVTIDEALTEVFARSGQVDRAIETGRRLLAGIGTSATTRSVAELHLLIAHAATSGGLWAEATASLDIARRLPHPEPARVDVCAARLAELQDHYELAAQLANDALRGAREANLPEVACEALEVIGKVLHHTDLDAAERALSQAEAIASAHGLRLVHVRVVSELGGLDMLRTGSLDRLQRARDMCAEQGALFQAAYVDLQLATGLMKLFRLDEALEVASRCTSESRRFRFVALAESLMLEAAVHAARGEPELMAAKIAESLELAPDDQHLLASAPGRCRAMLAMLDERIEQAWAELDAGAIVLLGLSLAPAAPFLGLWPLLGAVLGQDAAGAAAKVRSAHMARHGLIAGLLEYADAILAGRCGDVAAAEAAMAQADETIGPLLAWYRQYARRLAAQAALADGWGEPVAWLREAGAYFEARGDDRIAAACRRLMREAGAPVPRRRPGDADLPEQLRTHGVTVREANVLELVAEGLTNREIAQRLFLSPRTVEKHVASLLIKTGMRRRGQLAGYYAALDR